MSSDKCNSTTDEATGLISLLDDVTSSQNCNRWTDGETDLLKYEQFFHFPFSVYDNHS